MEYASGPTWTNPLVQRHSWSFMGSSVASVGFNLGCLVELIRHGMLSHLTQLTVEGPNVVLLGPLCGYFEHLCDPRVYVNTEHVCDLVGYPLTKLTERSVTSWLETLMTMPFRRAPIDTLRRHGITVTVFDEETCWVGHRGFNLLEIDNAPPCTWLAFVCVSLGIPLPHGTDSEDEEDVDGSLTGYTDYAMYAENQFAVHSQLEYVARQVKKTCWVVSIAARPVYLEEASRVCGAFDAFHCLLFPMLNIGEPDPIRTELENRSQLRYCKPLEEEEWHAALDWSRELVKTRFEAIKRVHKPLRFDSIPVARLPLPAPPPTVCSTVLGWFRRVFKRDKPAPLPPPPTTPTPTPVEDPPPPRARSNSLPRITRRIKTTIARSKEDLDITVGELQSLELSLQLELFDDYDCPLENSVTARRRRVIRP